MRWTTLNTEMYLSAEEFVDTAIIPIAPFEMEKDKGLEKSTFQSEYLNLLTLELEKELTGRLLLMPVYFYTKTSLLEAETERLNSFVNEITKQPFNHVFFITFDPKWKKYEEELKGNLIWLPISQTESTDLKKIKGVIEDQMNQLKELIKVYW